MREWKWQYAELTDRVLDNKFVIVIPCYNAEETIRLAVLSALIQEFDNLAIIIRNDMSTDKTGDIVKDVFGINPGEGDFYIKNEERDIIYIENKKKFYGGGNTYDSVMRFVNDPYAIVGVVDGDDYLYTTHAAKVIYEAYQELPERWLIWSQHASKEQDKRGYAGYSRRLPADEVIYSSRKYWGVSHFRTCLAGLFHLLDPADLADPNDSDSYAKICGDAALLYPIIEMCGNARSLFINQILYYYNDGIPSNDFQVYRSEIEDYRAYFEDKEPYKQLGPDHVFEIPVNQLK